jgi:hypothetical protein
MSKKLVKLAGRHSMLVLAMLAVVALVLLLAHNGPVPTAAYAQQNSTNSTPNNEAVDCVKASTTTNCTEGVVAFSGMTLNPAMVCIGSPVGAAVNPPTITPGEVIVDTSYTNANPNATNTTCDDTYTTNYPTPNPTYTWTASGCGVSASGKGLSTSALTPTNCGTVTITFTATWPDACDTNKSSISVGGNINVDSVTSLTPSVGLWVDDGDGDPNTDTYLVQYECYDDVIVTASDCLGLSSSDLPSCWNMTGGTEIDRKTHSVDGNTVGKIIITVNCGTSYKKVTIIVYQAIYTISADGNISLDPFTFGHAWWALSVQPSDVYQYLKKADGTDLSQGAPSGALCAGGYFGTSAVKSVWISGCPGEVIYGTQPIIGTNPQKNHSATGTYWWCVSFGHLIGALSYAYDLNNNPGTYYFFSNNCVTQALEVGSEAGISVGYSNIYPVGLSDYLNQLLLAGVPYCYCQQ